MGENLLQAQYAEAPAQPLHPLSGPPFFERPSTSATDATQVITLVPTLQDSGDTENVEEEPYTIKCICGYFDDDGSTVLCEQCNTWQHIECYYPGIDIPEVHKCTDCYPRPAHLNPEEATERQKKLRESLRSPEDERRVKRTGPKGQRKSKLKDSGQIQVQTNGWQYVEGVNSHSDANSGSPGHYELPPPKRSKTLHKTVASLYTSNSRPANHRHRSSSSIDSSPIKLPPEGCSAQFLSPEFIRIHHTNTDFTPAQANLHLDIGVSNLLSTWLDDPEAFSEATNGLTQNEVFKHFPQPIEELETSIQKRVFTDTRATIHGRFPIWPYLTVDQDLLAGDFVGELRGSIGHRDDYRADPSNNWEHLRHPEHFVFFHPYLPIYIDCRSEGTLLRYARRSCRPNLKLETIITGAREYRFCFTAMTSIPRDTEITVGWDTLADPQLQEAFKLGSTAMNDSKRVFVQDWVVTILAHFGGCACNPSDDSLCLMEHFDPRLDHLKTRSRASKSHKGRKGIKKSSPATGRIIDHRAGSEGLNSMEVDDDVDEDRSTSRSSRSRTSRDASPSIAGSPRDSSAPLRSELSERDKKKLMQQERLFDKLAQEEHQGQRRRKRASGSNANTPVPNPTAKHLARSSSTNPNTPAPGFRSRIGDNSSSYFGPVVAQPPSGQSSRARSPIDQTYGQRRSLKAVQVSMRPIYVDNFTQTREASNELLPEDPQPRAETYMALSQRILRRSHIRALRVTKDSTVIKPQIPNHELYESGASPMIPKELTTAVEKYASPTPNNYSGQEDIEMAENGDQNSTAHGTLMSVEKEESKSPPALEMSKESLNPPTPPWPKPEPSSNAQQREPGTQSNLRTTNLHVELPLPPFHNIGTPGGIPLATAPSMSSRASAPPPASNGSTVAAYALATAPILSSSSISASNNNAIQPSPAKKKMSLSDYVKKRKAETPTLEKPPNIETSSSHLAVNTLQGSKNPTIVSDTAMDLADVKDEEPVSTDEVIQSDATEG